MTNSEHDSSSPVEAASPRETPKNVTLSSALRAAIQRIDADCKAPTFPGMEPAERVVTIYEILTATRAAGVDIPEAMTTAMFGDGYQLSHQRRLLAITLARALPELAALTLRVAELEGENADERRVRDKVANDLEATHAELRSMQDLGVEYRDRIGIVQSECARLREENERLKRRNPFAMPTRTRGDDWGALVRFACDDATTGDQLDLTIQRGGNGDWYVSVVPKGEKPLRGVRISTSGGASFRVPGLTSAICDAYDAIYFAALAALPEPADGR